MITICSNEHGPYYFPEKLIPLAILNAIRGKPIPICGRGDQIRDWLYLEDYAGALVKVIFEGTVGEPYDIGGHNERTNRHVVETLCDLLDACIEQEPHGLNSFRELIRFVADQPGHDQRYAIDASKIEATLDWTPVETFESGLTKTVD